MLKQFCYDFSSLVLILLLASACQPSVAANGTPTTERSLPAAPTAGAIETTTTAQSPTTLPKSLPTARSDSTAIPKPEAMWIFQTGAAIWGTPAISDGIVYIGSDDGNLYAVDSHTGRLKWKFSTKGIVRSKPEISGGLVTFTSDDGFLYAVDASSGQQIWNVDIGNTSDREKRVNPGTNPDPLGFDYLQSSPVAVDGQIFVGSNNCNVYALTADRGRIQWKFTTGGKVRASPTVKDGIVYIGSWDGMTYTLDSLTGQVRWRTPIGGQIQTTVLVANGLVFTASRKASVMALDAQTGNEKWEYYYGKNMWVESSPRLVGNTIYIGSSGNQYVLGLDSQNGNLLTAYSNKVFFWSTPVIMGDMLYIGGAAYTQTSAVGSLFGLKIPGQVTDSNLLPIKFNWLYPTAKTLMPDGNWAGVASSPVVQNSVIYFGGLDGKLYALKTEP